MATTSSEASTKLSAGVSPARKCAREAPAHALMLHDTNDPAFPNVGDPEKPDSFEERLRVEVIQGNVIDGGFNKDFQTILCLRIVDATYFKRWLKTQIPYISTAAEVLTFNRLFKEIRTRRGEPAGITATWINISFSFQAIELLTGNGEAAAFIDESFKAGLAARSEQLGDPTSPRAEGNQSNWLVGGVDHEAHVLMLVAADERCDMLAEVARIEQSIYAFRCDGQRASSGAEVIFREEGANLPAPLAGHEHFGTLDGISQPGVRGRVSEDPTDVLTPRQNPQKVDGANRRIQGKPGQELLWPGEFVFGYLGQNPDADTLETSRAAIPTKAVDSAGDHWTDNGSFLVFRRLRQDVAKFHQFLQDQAVTLETDPLLVSSKLVGRWVSGAPTVRNPDADQPAMGDDDCANNDFEFNAGVDVLDLNSGPNDCVDRFPGDPKDDATDAGSDAATGMRCPFAAHTRKSYPRNDLTPAGVTSEQSEQAEKSEVDTQTHRMLRRGIPYGRVSPSTPAQPIADSVDRGLHFFAYQTSITNQFEFVTTNWVNNPDFSTEAAKDHECGGVLPLGHDPIIGQSEQPDGDRTRKFFIRFTDDNGVAQCRELTAPEDWVIPTGGGYFFTPSLDALKNTLS